MSAEIVRNAPVREEYETALKALEPILYICLRLLLPSIVGLIQVR